MIMGLIRKIAAKFWRDERGSIALETILVMPILFWGYLGMFTYFDLFRNNIISQKAVYTISDMLSRETNSVNQTYLSGAKKLLEYLVYAPSENVSLRVSSVRYDAAVKKYKIKWSQVEGKEKYKPLVTDDLKNASDFLPQMLGGEYILLIETWVDYTPVFSIGLGTFEMSNLVFASSRYSSHLNWSEN